MEEITPAELKERLDKGDDIQIVDVREDNEVAIGRIPNSIHIPLGQILGRMNEIDPSRETVVHCKMGGRSARAISPVITRPAPWLMVVTRTSSRPADSLMETCRRTE